MSDDPMTGQITIPASVPAAGAGMTTKVVRGSLWTLGGQGVTIVAMLIATPFIIRLLGSEAYGVLALVNLLIGYLAFADMGMGSAAIRFSAEAHARGDDEGEIAIVWTALLVAFVPALLSASALALFAWPLAERALRLPAHLQAEAVLAIRLASLGFVARTVGSVLNAPQLARLRMDLNTLTIVGNGVAQNCLVPVVLLMGGHLVSAVAVITGLAIANIFVQAAISSRLLRRLLRPRLSLGLAKPLTRFGAGLIVSMLAGMALINGEKLLLTRFASVSALAHYSVAFAVAGILTVVPNAMRHSLLPAFSRLAGQPSSDPLKQLYIRAVRGNLLWIAPIALLLCVGAKPFFTLWAGPEYGRESTLPFYILMVGLIFNVIAYIPHTLLMAFGRSDLIARFHAAELLPYILCAALLTYRFGIIGAALAWSLRVVIDAVLFFLAVKRVAGFRFSPFPINQGSYLLAIMALSLPLLIIVQLFDSLAILSCVAIASLLLYGGLVWTRVLTDQERAWMYGMVMWRRREMSAGRL